MISYAVAAIVLFVFFAVMSMLVENLQNTVNDCIWFDSFTIILAYVYGEKFYTRTTFGDI